MQKLSRRRLTDTPTDIPHVRGNCGSSLNSPGGKGSVARLTTRDNSSDAVLTATGRAGRNLRVSAVYVLNKRGEPLMPCSPRKARVLLRGNRAVVVNRTPFRVRLAVPTGESIQQIVLGVDSGFAHVGLSAVCPIRELFSADIKLRTDMVKLNSERRQYRKARRSRKTWYRKPRFLNRRKPDGWLAPSIQHKLDSHIKLIQRVQGLLPVARAVIEVAAFDIQKIKNPGITGTGYQSGPQKDFWNVREYVLYRDRHTCQHCKGRSKDPVLEVHHYVSRQTGGDSPGNLVTLCRTCHHRVSRGELVLKVKPPHQFRAETFMSIVRWRLVNEVRAMSLDVSHTYGYVTKNARIALGLTKSHENDAFVIAGGNGQARFSSLFAMRQVRKCNRKLFKGDRSQIRNTAPREVFGFRRWDRVLCDGTEFFIKGRRLRGEFALSGIDGKLLRETSHRNLTLVERARTTLIERRQAAIPPVPLKGKGSLAA